MLDSSEDFPLLDFQTHEKDIESKKGYDGRLDEDNMMQYNDAIRHSEQYNNNS